VEGLRYVGQVAKSCGRLAKSAFCQMSSTLLVAAMVRPAYFDWRAAARLGRGEPRALAFV